MERHQLERLLAGDDAASVAALAALQSGGTHDVSDRASPSERHAGVFGIRLRNMRRKGVGETLGLERAVELLGQRHQPVRVGQIMAADRSWYYLVFLTEDGSALVACAGVRQQFEQPPSSGAV
ncbi:hypothetical protein [Streptomyces sp. NPDC059761]|uniref:hypothetical protein n=1 Tax=Streptomyces sp. NPDC059761 TaxID=3346937 RepID=UPI003664AE81